MDGLPAGLADPLHLREPISEAWLWRFALLAILLLLLWWRRRRFLQAKGAEPLAAPPEPSKAHEPDRIERLFRRHAEARTYRAGCHELSSLLRMAFETSGREGEVAWSRRTARELRAVVGEGAESRLLSRLERHQFGRREPGRRELESACDLGRLVLGGAQTGPQAARREGEK